MLLSPLQGWDDCIATRFPHALGCILAPLRGSRTSLTVADGVKTSGIETDADIFGLMAHPGPWRTGAT